MTRSTKGLIASAAIAGFMIASPAFAADGDVKKGEKAYKTKCKSCHSIKPNVKRVGPSLFAVIGRKCGTAPKTRFSKGYKAACEAKSFTWDAASIDEYIKNPKAYMSKLAGKKVSSPMAAVKIKKEKRRANILAYLKTLK